MLKVLIYLFFIKNYITIIWYLYIFIDKHFPSKYILPSTILTVKFNYNEMNEVIGISAFFWMIHEEKWDYQRIERIHNELVWLNNEQMTSLYITHGTLSHNSLMLLDLRGFAILGNYKCGIKGHFTNILY